jgi:hypothetical protein
MKLSISSPQKNKTRISEQLPGEDSGILMQKATSPTFLTVCTPENSAMSESRRIQRCVICAWRGECRKKFCIPDGGQRCPDFTRDITIKLPEDEEPEKIKET